MGRFKSMIYQLQYIVSIVLIILTLGLRGQTNGTINQQSLDMLEIIKKQNPNIDYPFYFAVIADAHAGIAGKFVKFENLINSLINANFEDSNHDGVRDHPLAFIISVGDIISLQNSYNYEQSHILIYNNFLNPNDNSITHIPFFIVPGNHETRTDPENTLNFNLYDEYFGEYNTPFAFDYGNSRFVCLKNFEIDPDHNQSIRGALIPNEVYSLITTKPQEIVNTFTFAHLPLLSNRTFNKGTYASEYNSYVDFLQGNNVRANFHGHIHEFHKYYKCPGNNYENGIFDITVGSGGNNHGSDEYNDNPNIYLTPSEQMSSIHDFLIVEVDEFNNISVKMHMVENDYTNSNYLDYNNHFDFTIYGKDIIPEFRNNMNVNVNVPAENTIITSFGTHNIHYEKYRYLTPFAVETTENLNDVSLGIDLNGNATIRSQKSVTLNKGFYANYGSSFLADIITVCSDLEQQNIWPKSKSDNSYEEKLISGNDSSKYETQMTIYPNPNVGKFMMELTMPYDSRVTIEVYNMIGSKVIDNVQYCKKGKNIVNLNLENPVNGIYLITAKTEREVFNKKVVVR